MRIVQYEAGGRIGCGVEVEGAVYATDYADTLTLIRDGARGLEHAQGAPERGLPIAVDRLLAPLTNPERSSARASKAGRLPDDGHPGRLRHVHGPTALPAAG